MIKYNDISIDCAATKIHIDLTGGWKSALLFYLCAKDVDENQNNNTSIVPCVVRRINRYDVEKMNRPDSVEIVKKQIEWIKNSFPNVIIESVISIDADFWWIKIPNTSIMPIDSYDVSEKVLLRHTYEMCTNTRIFPRQNLLPDLPIIKSFNANCRDLDVPNLYKKKPYIDKKIYEYGTEISDEEISLCDNKIIALQPFLNTTKTNLVEIAKTLNILDILDKVTYTCEQSTTEIIDPCGICFNCEQMKRAIENNE